MGQPYRRELKYVVNNATKLRDQLRDEQQIDKKIYNATASHYLAIRECLTDSLDIINELLQKVDLSGPNELQPSFYDKNDISEIIYSPKVVVKTFATQINGLCQMDYPVEDAADCARLLHTWYHSRFLAPVRDNSFYYKALRIPEWVDLIILSYANACEQRLKSKYLHDFDDWIGDLAKEPCKWPVPLFVQDIMNSPYPEDFTQQAILLEDLIKPHLYNNSFLPDKLHTVSQIVIQRSNNENLILSDVNKMIEVCYPDERGGQDV